MIININKLTDITKVTVDITDGRPYLYFLFHIDEHTPRYSLINNNYVPDPHGHFVIDTGLDLFHKTNRVLKYIGQTKGDSISRILTHYYFDIEETKRKNKKNKAGYIIQKGIGPVFTHMRMIKLPRFIYDNVRVHHETVLVRKYLPEINRNSSSVFGDIQKMIILNSKGKVTIQDLIYPYALHARDVWKAAEAYKREDWEWVKANCAVPNKYRHLTIEQLKSGKYSFGENFWMGKVHGKYFGQKPGQKKQFGRWFRAAIVFKHNKQFHAKKEFNQKMSKLRKLYGDDNINQLILFHEEKELHS